MTPGRLALAYAAAAAGMAAAGALTAAAIVALEERASRALCPDDEDWCAADHVFTDSEDLRDTPTGPRPAFAGPPDAAPGEAPR